MSVSPGAESGSAVSVPGQGSPGWHQLTLHRSATQTLPVAILSWSRPGTAEVAAGTGSRSRGPCAQGGEPSGGLEEQPELLGFFKFSFSLESNIFFSLDSNRIIIEW